MLRRINMYRHLRHLLGRAGPQLASIPPAPSRMVMAMLRWIGPIYLRFGMNVGRVIVEDSESTDLFGSGGNRPPGRIFIAFRHPSPDDPLVVYYLLQKRCPSAGTYPVFLYGRDVPVWAGPVAGWLLPRIGGISVFHEEMRRDSLDELYRAVSSASGPIVLAPEGQVTYHNYRTAPTQRGTAHLARWAAAQTGSPSHVVPLALEYRYPDDRSNTIFVRLLGRVEALTGVSSAVDHTDGPDSDGTLVTRTWRAAAALVDTVANHYRVAGCGTPDGQRIPDTEDINAAMQRIIMQALSEGERHANVTAGHDRDPISRVFRLRRIYWNALFPAHRGTGKLGRALDDLRATEARIVARHFQTVDLLAYLDFTYLSSVGITPGTSMPEAGSAAHARLVEYLLAMDDLSRRVMGHTIGRRYSWPRRRCTCRFGRTISVEPSRSARSLHGEIENTLDELSSLR